MKLIARFILWFKRKRHPTWAYRECPNCHWFMEHWGGMGLDGWWDCDHCNWAIIDRYGDG